MLFQIDFSIIFFYMINLIYLNAIQAKNEAFSFRDNKYQLILFPIICGQIWLILTPSHNMEISHDILSMFITMFKLCSPYWLYVSILSHWSLSPKGKAHPSLTAFYSFVLLFIMECCVYIISRAIIIQLDISSNLPLFEMFFACCISIILIVGVIYIHNQLFINSFIKESFEYGNQNVIEKMTLHGFQHKKYSINYVKYYDSDGDEIEIIFKNNNLFFIFIIITLVHIIMFCFFFNFAPDIYILLGL